MEFQSVSYAARAKRIFLRGLAHKSPDEAIQAGVRTEAQWLACLEGQKYRLCRELGKAGRRKVKKRHPMRHAA